MLHRLSRLAWRRSPAPVPHARPMTIPERQTADEAMAVERRLADIANTPVFTPPRVVRVSGSHHPTPLRDRRFISEEGFTLTD